MNHVPPMSAGQLAAATGDYAAAGLPAPMDGERFRDLWKATGLSLAGLAAMIGMRGRHASTHLREMADGVRPVPGPTGVAVEALAFGWRPGAERFDGQDLEDRIAEAIDDANDMDVTSADLARAALAEFQRYIAGELWGEARPWPSPAERLRDLRYLQEAEAHADEGRIGETGARSILGIALKYVRLLAAAVTPLPEGQQS